MFRGVVVVEIRGGFFWGFEIGLIDRPLLRESLLLTSHLNYARVSRSTLIFFSLYARAEFNKIEREKKARITQRTISSVSRVGVNDSRSHPISYDTSRGLSHLILFPRPFRAFLPVLFAGSPVDFAVDEHVAMTPSHSLTLSSPLLRHHASRTQPRS